MDDFNDDLLAFAEHLGLTGVESDLFYESYYQLDNAVTRSEERRVGSVGIVERPPYAINIKTVDT